MNKSKHRNNGNLNGGQDIMMNLLGDSSESDQTTLLDLPPIKGKKPKRKRNNYGAGPPSQSCCDVWFIMKTSLMLVLVCAVSVLGFVTVWLSGQVTDLKAQVEMFQNKNGERVGSIQSLESRLDEMKKTVDRYKTGENGLDQLHINLDEISKKIATLNSTLRDSLNMMSASDIKQITTQVPVISNSVASLGVDVKSLKNTVEELVKFKDSAEQQIKSYQQNKDDSNKQIHVSPTSQSMSPEIANDIAKKFQSLSDGLVTTNTSLWTEMQRLQIVLDGHQTKFALVDNVTATLQKRLDTMATEHSSINDDHKDLTNPNSDNTVKAGLSEDKVKVIVHQMIESMGIGNVSNDEVTLNQLMKNMDNVTGMVQALKSQLSQTSSKSPDDKHSSDTDFVLAHDDLVNEIQLMNKTIKHVNADLTTLIQKVTQQQNQLVNLSHTVHAVKQFVDILEKDHNRIIKLGNSSSSTSAGPAVPTTASMRNTPPLASTAGKITLHLPLTELVLDATNSTDDKGIVKYRWEYIKGPSQLTISNEGKAKTTAKGVILEGKYHFAVQVWDEENLSSEIALYIEVLPPLAGKTIEPISTPTPLVETSKTSAAPNLHRYINMTLVKTSDDLHLGVRRWDKDGDGFVDANDLPDYMPDPPQPDDLKKFDFDHNGKYDYDEFAVALGFKPWPEDKETNDLHQEE